MTDHLDSVEEPNADDLAMIERLASRPDVWAELPSGLDDAVVAAIATERAAHPARISSGRRSATMGASGSLPWWLAAAAAVALVVAGVAIVTRGSDTPGGVEIAMSGTDASPGATASVILSSTPAGLKILLDAEGLDGAPTGYYYEAWVSDGTTRVSAGTFHLRGGDNEIELWAGVVDPAFNRLTVTLEPIDGDNGTSGDVRLVGEYQLTD